MSSTQRVSEALARPVRTGGQLGVSYAIMAVVQSFHQFTPEQFGALLGLLGLIVGAVQVAVENKLGVALLRTVSPKTTPVVSEEPAPVKKTTRTRARKDVGYGLIALLVLIAALVLVAVGVIAIIVAAVGTPAHLSTSGLIMVIIGIVLAVVARALDGGTGYGRRGL